MKLDATTTAIITGGASGLGAATARALRGLGVKVAIFDLNDAKGEPFAREIGATFCKVDVTDDASVEAGFARARGANGQERILVNCAGTAVAMKTASRAKDTGEIRGFNLAAFNSIIQINLVGTFRCVVKSAMGMLSLPPLDDGERGAIVNTASVAAEDGQMGQVAYTASKAGIVGMTLPIARDLSAEGIRVNTILPGIFDTPLMQERSAQREGGSRRERPLPEALRFARGVCVPGDRALSKRLPQRRGHPSGRCDPDATSLKPTLTSPRSTRARAREAYEEAPGVLERLKEGGRSAWWVTSPRAELSAHERRHHRRAHPQREALVDGVSEHQERRVAPREESRQRAGSPELQAPRRVDGIASEKDHAPLVDESQRVELARACGQAAHPGTMRAAIARC